MLNVPNSVAEFLLLCIFMAFINRSKAKGAVAGSIGVKYPNIIQNDNWCLEYVSSNFDIFVVS